jgi:two-component system NarL family sensor kinase
VQEALTNIHRHSESKTAAIRIACDDRRLTLEIMDRGKGISREKLAEIQAKGSGVGIRGMRERVRHFGGEMTFKSSSSGTTIIVVVPISKTDLKEKAANQPVQAIA